MEQIESLKQYLTSFLNIPATQWLHLITCLGFRSLGKGEFYFKQGEVHDEIGFVVKGLLYNFYTDQNGDEFVKSFVDQGNPVSCYSDLIQKTPSSFSSQTLEPTKLVTLRYTDLLKLYDKHSCWERMGRVSAEKLFIEKEHRERLFLTSDAKARYETFAQENPNLMNRIPQYLLASHIGISPVSLSRIRRI